MKTTIKHKSKVDWDWAAAVFARVEEQDKRRAEQALRDAECEQRVELKLQLDKAKKEAEAKQQLMESIIDAKYTNQIRRCSPGLKRLRLPVICFKGYALCLECGNRTTKTMILLDSRLVDLRCAEKLLKGDNRQQALKRVGANL